MPAARRPRTSRRRTGSAPTRGAGRPRRPYPRRADPLVRWPAARPEPRPGTPPPVLRRSWPSVLRRGSRRIVTDELVADPVRYTGEVELKREALLEPVALLDVPRVDPVQ